MSNGFWRRPGPVRGAGPAWAERQAKGATPDATHDSQGALVGSSTSEKDALRFDADDKHVGSRCEKEMQPRAAVRNLDAGEAVRATTPLLSVIS